MIGDRIKQARKASGLSLRALAENAGITAMAISKYENNKSTPSSGVLLGLARALDLKVEYFFRTSKVELHDIEYRKHSKLPKKVLAQIEGDVIEQIERFIDLEKFLPNSPIEDFTLPKELPSEIEDYDDIESIADIVRKAWKLGGNSIPDLMDTLEERGIRVFQTKAFHNDKFDGLTAEVNEFHVIVVGRDWPGDRQRFTLSHELGHLILKGRLPPHLDDEKAANRFAGAFLAPKAEVLKELGSNRNWLEPVELHLLKQTYGLSMGAWIYRASDLGILNKSATQKMWRYFRERNWIKVEPGGQYSPEVPKLFKQLIFHAYAEQLISESKAAELLAWPTSTFRTIRNKVSCEQEALNQ
ncbi:MAG: ImmA/IrrE family metallo-endopeptidase [Ectothiorhodospiraceae bacterium]|nr:ImmA/IrrE family metallo-endopeptidase [Ectothiorhodospiraceae bacterium]